jgi:acyl carrier protein
MVFEKIRALLSEQLDIEEDEITMESKLAEDLGADSLDVVDLIMAIEDEFEVEVLDEDIEKVVTVGDIVNYVSDNR